MQNRTTFFVNMFLLALLVLIGGVIDKANGEVDKASRYLPWRLQDNVIASRGDDRLLVYEDPLYTNSFLVVGIDTCWMVDLTEHYVSYPSCSLFEISSSGVVLRESKFTEVAPSVFSKIQGYPWLDNQMDCGAYISALFRKPKFYSNKIKFWDCDQWVEILVNY
ncbi:MAG: hypothetical protein JXA04_04855 [Gammaproteobacteria bacterium]|nr:hypothetical protein [Gammaproteobacteria bacterium]